jgi:mannan endo-1,4-beta-mannosidase
VSWWPVDPFTGQTDNDRGIDFSQLTQPGTAPYIAWYKLLDQQIAILKSINGPVLYRPFVEMNGNWSWWGAQPTAEMVTVQQQMHDYFVSKGVNNILWVFNVNDWNGNYTQYYPGAAYADIVSWDAYPPMPNDPTYAALVTLNKPIMLAESGVETANNSALATFSGDNSQLLATVKSNFPKVFAIVLWCQNWGLPEQNGEAAFMNDSAMVSLGDLPSGLVDP